MQFLLFLLAQILHSNFDRTKIIIICHCSIATQRFSDVFNVAFRRRLAKKIHKYSIVTTVDHICDVRYSVDVRLICSSPYSDLFLNISLVINCVAYYISSCFVSLSRFLSLVGFSNSKWFNVWLKQRSTTSLTQFAMQWLVVTISIQCETI